MFQNQAQTQYFLINGNTTATLFSGENTILNISAESNGDDNLQIRCDTDFIFTPNKKDKFYDSQMNYKCDGDIIVQNIKNDSSYVVLTYIDFIDNSTTTDVTGFDPSTEISSSSDIQVYGYMSSGEILIAFLLLLIIILQLFGYLASALNKITTKKTYLGYNGGDVEIREDV